MVDIEAPLHGIAEGRAAWLEASKFDWIEKIFGANEKLKNDLIGELENVLCFEVAFDENFFDDVKRV